MAWKVNQDKGENMSKNSNPYVNQVLWGNGFKTVDKVKEFLLTDSFPLKLDHSALFTKEINKIKENNEKVVFVGDYDVDGAMSTAICIKFAEDLKLNYEWLIPNRFKDGYGLKEPIVDRAKELGADAIITVDNGIKSKSAIKHAKDLGIRVLVTDHHHADLNEIPTDAVAIINPHFENENLEFKDVCGAKVIYSLVRDYYNNSGLNRTLLLEEMEEFVALATVADVMPLWKGNRFLLKKFIEKAKTEQIKNRGINKIMELMKIDSITFDEGNIGFQIGPLLNAPGRMISAELSVHIMIEQNNEKLDELVNDAISINNERKAEVDKALKSVVFDENDSVHSVVLEDVSEGIIGIISGRITEKTLKPSFTFVKNGENYKGSGRSPSNYNLIEGAIRVFEKYPELTLGYGGHAGAMGLTIKDRKSVDIFKEKLDEDYRKMKPEEVVRYFIYYDRDTMDLKELHESVNSLRPFGEGFKAPVFRTDGEVFRVRNFGERKNHSMFAMKSPRKGYFSNYSYFRNKMEEGKKQEAEVYFETSISYSKEHERFYYRGNVVDLKLK